MRWGLSGFQELWGDGICLQIDTMVDSCASGSFADWALVQHIWLLTCPNARNSQPCQVHHYWPFKCNCSSYTTCYKGHTEAIAWNHLVLPFAKNHPLPHYWTCSSCLLPVPLALCFVFWYLVLFLPHWGTVQNFFSLIYRLRTLVTKFWLLFLNLHALLILVYCCLELETPSTTSVPQNPHKLD